MDRYEIVNGKKLRYGYTTGTSATGASLGSLLNLIGKKQEKVVVKALNGWDIDIILHNQEQGADWAMASVEKDSGDDPDITKGIHIYSKVRLGEPENKKGYFVNERKNIYLKGGQGVGLVTKKGLQVEVGYHAINPGPRKMIFETLEPLLGKDIVITIEISVPEGEEKAKKTFNPKLGIVGGISILGSTGVVKPMSEEAWVNSIKVELKVSREENGREELLLTFGNYGKKFIEEHTSYDRDRAIITSNFIGTLVDEAYELGFKKIILVGHIGKFIKLSGGIFQTHSKIADARLELLTTCGYLGGESKEVLDKIIGSNTTEEAVDYIENESTWQVVADRAKKYLRARTYNEIDIEVGFFAFEKGKLYMD